MHNNHLNDDSDGNDLRRPRQSYLMYDEGTGDDDVRKWRTQNLVAMIVIIHSVKLGGDANLYKVIRRVLTELTNSLLKKFGRHNNPLFVSGLFRNKPGHTVCCRGPSETNCFYFSNRTVHLVLFRPSAPEILKKVAAS